MRSAMEFNPQEGNASTVKYLLNWTKDLVIPEADLMVKWMSIALPAAQESRTWFIGLCLHSVGRYIS